MASFIVMVWSVPRSKWIQNCVFSYIGNAIAYVNKINAEARPDNPRAYAKTVTERWLTVVPAYGRDYANAAQVKSHWDAGKDFRIQDISCKWNGACINKEDATSNYDVIKVRFAKLAEFCLIRGDVVEDCTEPAE